MRSNERRDDIRHFLYTIKLQNLNHLKMSETEAVMKKLEAIRNENAALYEKISELKRFSPNAGNDGENVETADELEQVLTKERSELLKLKKEYTSIISEKDLLDAEIEQKTIYLNKEILPQLKEEGERTQQYYLSLVSKIETMPNVNVDSIKKLISAVQIKRDYAQSLQDEYEKMKQFIAINKYTPEVNREVLPDLDELLNFDKDQSDSDDEAGPEGPSTPDQASKKSRKKVHRRRQKQFKAMTLKPGSVPMPTRKPRKKVPLPSVEH